MAEFFLKTAANTWEEVPEYVAKNAKFALDGEGRPRYSDVSVIKENQCIKATGVLTSRDLSILARVLNITPLLGNNIEGRILTPEAIQFKKGNSNRLYQVATGEIWKK